MLDVNGTRLYYEDTGGGGEPIVFSHGVLWNCRMYDKQVEALRGRYRCIAYDHRGQGQSDVPRVDVIDMETLYADAVALIEKLGVGPCHFVGLSMGGFVGMRLAARRPDLVRSLVLMETRAEAEAPEKVRRYRLLTTIVRWVGVRPVVDRGMNIMFGRTFMSDPARAADRDEWRRRLLKTRRDIYRAVNGVIYRQGVEGELSRIRVPTLVMVGEEDNTTGLQDAQRIQQGVPGAELVHMPRCGHTSTVENPAAVNDILTRFLASTAARQTG
jgi:pimeloyl-ACP methyl ester carboxylesterase